MSQPRPPCLFRPISTTWPPTALSPLTSLRPPATVVVVLPPLLLSPASVFMGSGLASGLVSSGGAATICRPVRSAAAAITCHRHVAPRGNYGTGSASGFLRAGAFQQAAALGPPLPASGPRLRSAIVAWLFLNNAL